MRIENSFIPVHGVGEKTERKLWRNGIHHWDEFDGSVVGDTRAARIEEFIETAQSRLSNEDAEFFSNTVPNQSIWRLYENFQESACYLDIETTGLSVHSDEITLVSMYFPGQNRTETLVRGDDLSRARLESELDEANILVTFNGKTFDVPALEQSFGLDFSIPHLDLRYPARRLGLDGGLKDIEYIMGIERENSGLTGRDAVRLWHEYRSGDASSLETLIEYNRSDVENLEEVCTRILSGLHEEVFESVADVPQQRLTEIARDA